MSEILEIIMMLCFGVSWPMNISKSFKSRSNKGKSLLFLCFILIGYIAGIISKLTNEFYIASFNQKWYLYYNSVNRFNNKYGGVTKNVAPPIFFFWSF